MQFGCDQPGVRGKLKSSVFRENPLKIGQSFDSIWQSSFLLDSTRPKNAAVFWALPLNDPPTHPHRG
jgi:hypothetical protein